jgi:hypothetical protein
MLFPFLYFIYCYLITFILLLQFHHFMLLHISFRIIHFHVNQFCSIPYYFNYYWLLLLYPITVGAQSTILIKFTVQCLFECCHLFPGAINSCGVACVFGFNLFFAACTTCFNFHTSPCMHLYFYF